MLRCVLRDIYGKEIVIPRLLSLQVDIDEGVPADSVYAVFPDMKTDELAGITLYDGTEPVFVGIVDEEEHEHDARGEYLKISARSPAAHLLDNEAAPTAYDHPSLGLIYERYVKPYGIRLNGGGDAVYFGEQSITKGSSCWRVLKKFCTACYSSVPRISSVGELFPKGIQRAEAVVFGDGGIRYTALREIRKRCEEISAVYVKTSAAEPYTLSVGNAQAEERGVRRARYLNAVLTESPMRCADAMIANGKAKAYAVKLRCPCCLVGREGMRAALSGSGLDIEDGLYISAVHYRITNDGEYSNVTLKRRSADVDK